jgi:glycerophosphoryl diester phosphodiesterase
MAIPCYAKFKNPSDNLKMRILISFFILFSLMQASCSKIKYYPDKDFPLVTTRILAHRAVGQGPSLFNPYSSEAAEHSFSILDGVEVDLQISKDRTIWLSHGAELPDCGGKIYNCFPEATDVMIQELDSCNGNSNNFTRLEDIFELMALDYPGKFISLDVKAWEPCALASTDVLGVMNVIGDEIIRLTKKYNLQNQVLVESETAYFLNYVRRKSTGIECYLQSWGDFERAMLLSLESGYSGISFKYKYREDITADNIELARRKGLKVQLWTVNKDEDLNEALLINPDYIQTDNLTFFLKNIK